MHTLFEHLVDGVGVSLREAAQVHRSGAAGEVAVEHIGVERSDGCHEQRHLGEAFVERLVGAQIAVPEASAIESHIPVAKVVDHKFADSASCFGEFVVFNVSRYICHERIEH